MLKVWQFATERFTVALHVTELDGYRYDGDDEDGETQAAIDSGEFVAFDSIVTVSLDGNEIAWDSLGGSVYRADSMAEFWQAHRAPDPMQRNCSIMRAANGGNVCIGHYFPDMVREAVRQARRLLSNTPRIRQAA